MRESLSICVPDALDPGSDDKSWGRFADSAGEALGENISDYLAPLFSGAGSEITSRISKLFPGVT